MKKFIPQIVKLKRKMPLKETPPSTEPTKEKALQLMTFREFVEQREKSKL
jgi:hypothetical protein